MLLYKNISKGKYISEQSTNYRSSAKEMSEFVGNRQVGWSWASHETAYVKGL